MNLERHKHAEDEINEAQPNSYDTRKKNGWNLFHVMMQVGAGSCQKAEPA